jgi:integrase
MPTFYKPGTRKKSRNGNQDGYSVRGYVNGQQLEITTSAKNKRDAQSAWDKFKQSIIAQSTETTSRITFSQAIDLYETQPRSRDTIKINEKLRKWIGHIELASITIGDIHQLANRMLPKKTHKNSYKNRRVIAPVSIIINYAAKSNWCNYIKGGRLKESETLKRHPSPNAAHLMMANTSGVRRLYIAALHYHGLRPSDCFSIKCEDINLKEKHFSFIISKTQKRKTIVMKEEFFMELVNYGPPDTGFLFPWRKRSSTYRWLNQLKKLVNVQFGAKLSRHKFASDIVSVGGSAYDLINVGSWTHPNSVQPYITLNKDRAKEMLKKIKDSKLD